jgi:hypothetical protein
LSSYFEIFLNISSEKSQSRLNNQQTLHLYRSHAAQNIKTPETSTNADAEHSAPELLKFNCSGLGLDSGWPVGFQPRSNTWTALRRPLASSSSATEPPNYQAIATA